MCVTHVSWSSTETAKFINGQTLYFFPCLGCSSSLILNNGKSLNAGFLCEMSLFILITTSPSLYPENILCHFFIFVSIEFFLHEHSSFFATNSRKDSAGHVHMYTIPFSRNFNAYS